MFQMAPHPKQLKKLLNDGKIDYTTKIRNSN